MHRVRHAVALTLAAALVGACGRGGEHDERAAPADIALLRDGDVQDGRVPRNATLETLLRSHNLPPDMSAALVNSVRAVFNPRELRADRPYRIIRTLDGLFREFWYEIDADRLLRVVTRGGASAVPAFDAAVVPLPKELEAASLSATITPETPSLVAALDAHGENVQLALELANILAGEIDFNSDLQPGDRLDVLFERATRHGEFIGYGDVKGVVLENGGRTITGIRFAGPDGRAGWYDTDGRSLKRQFLRSPLEFQPRITSRFSYRRLHPVHGTYRAHPGIDYAAPYGAPVVAVAPGIVVSAGWSGEAGRMVRLRHAGGYETSYLHLSSFAPGIRPGARVDQGQRIGRVGSSGTATGAHLDYRLRRNGAYVNPLVELSRMPRGDPIPADSLDAFMRQRDEVIGDLQGRINRQPH
jgi:murein DD-endopeptidase MepM/ murein hydrolase activator NlpD